MPGSLADSLPMFWRQFVDANGGKAMQALIAWRGGRRVQVPYNAAGSQLEAAIGPDAAHWLVDQRCGEPLVVPKGATWMRHLRNQEIWARFDAGDSVADIAADYCLHERQVKRIRAERPRANEPDITEQQELFT